MNQIEFCENYRIKQECVQTTDQNFKWNAKSRKWKEDMIMRLSIDQPVSQC